jgi:hypothetical protein
MSPYARFALWWLEARPIKTLREKRRRKKMASWLEYHPDETAEDFNVPTDEVSMSKVTEALGKLSKLRTSTKGGAAGLLAPLVVVLPFYDEINGLLIQACQSEDGPIVMLTGAAITWVSFYVAARLSKTPAKPGAL